MDNKKRTAKLIRFLDKKIAELCDFRKELQVAVDNGDTDGVEFLTKWILDHIFD